MSSYTYFTEGGARKTRVEVILLLYLKIQCGIYGTIFQILGQLGSKKDISEGLLALRESTLQWCNITYQPLLMPHTHCLPTVGGDLKTSIEVAIAYPGGLNIFHRRNKQYNY